MLTFSTSRKKQTPSFQESTSRKTDQILTIATIRSYNIHWHYDTCLALVGGKNLRFLDTGRQVTLVRCNKLHQNRHIDVYDIVNLTLVIGGMKITQFQLF